VSRHLSPYDINPLNINPLKNLIERFVDFEAVRNSGLQLFIAATNVHTGRLRIFSCEKIDADTVMASAALPYVFRAVEIDGVPYWDGGYTANPPILPFFRTTRTEDVVVVQINPVERAETPTSAQEILNRVNEITFNPADRRITRDRIRQPADRPGPAAAWHRRQRIPADQGAPHRARRLGRTVLLGRQAAQRLRILRAAAQARPARRAPLPRRPF
jgi:predicted acylesterase/phospholipase RssA